jgi:hypothetical protein
MGREDHGEDRRLAIHLSYTGFFPGKEKPSDYK